MKIEKSMDGTTKAISDGRGLSRILLGGCLLFSSLAVFHFFGGESKSSQFLGSIAASVMFLVVYLVSYENSHFIFDPSMRVVDWRRRTLFSRQSGRVSFDAVESVIAETTVVNDPPHRGYLSRRLILRTSSGIIPFTRAYTGDPDGQLLRFAAELNVLFGRDASSEILSAVRELIADGRETAAVRLIRAERGISLKAAREEVDFIKLSTINAPLPNKPRTSLPLDAQAALARGNRIEAIKYIRETTGLGLKEANEVIELYLRDQSLPPK